MSNFSVLKLPKFERQYRGRKENQPCNNCRKRKVKCLVNVRPPCELCSKKGVKCFFNRTSVYHEPNDNDGAEATSSISKTNAMENGQIITTIDSSNLNEESTNDLKMDWLEFFFDSEIAKELTNFISLGQEDSLSLTSREAYTKELDSTAYSYTHYVSNGEYDPFLRFLFYHYDSHNECKFQRKHFRREGFTLKNPIIFGFISNDINQKQELSLVEFSDNDFENYNTFTDILQKYKFELLKLYNRFVFQTLPIFDPLDIEDANLTIDSILLLSMYMVLRRWESFETNLHWIEIERENKLIPEINTKYTKTYIYINLMKQLCRPSLSTIKTYILFLEIVGFEKFGSSGIQFQASLLSTMNNVCYMLGLNTDCTIWNIPTQEKSMRVRLWWINYIQNKWISCSYGLPSSIDEAFFNIPNSPIFHIGNKYFENFIKLTQILSNIHKDLFSFSSDKYSETAYLQLCDDYEDLLNEFNNNIPTSLTNHRALSTDPSISIGSLRLCYFVLHILIARARFKTLGSAIFIEKYIDVAVNVFQEAIVFLLALKLENITGVWFSFTKSHLIYLKDFALLLIMNCKEQNSRNLILKLTKDYKEWLEKNAKCLEICWPALLRLNIATESIGKQFRDSTLK